MGRDYQLGYKGWNGLSELGEQDRQLGLFCQAARRADRLNAALDQISRRFGSQAVVPADLAPAREDPDDPERP